MSRNRRLLASALIASLYVVTRRSKPVATTKPLPTLLSPYLDKLRLAVSFDATPMLTNADLTIGGNIGGNLSLTGAAFSLACLPYFLAF